MLNEINLFVINKILALKSTMPRAHYSIIIRLQFLDRIQTFFLSSTEKITKVCGKKREPKENKYLAPEVGFL